MAVKRVVQNVNDAVNQSNLISVALMKALSLDQIVNTKMSVSEVATLIANAIGNGGGVVVDAELSTTSTNPVQNKVITGALNNKVDILTSAPSSNNESGKFSVVVLDAEPSTKYEGYLYVIDTGASPSTPTTISGDTIILGTDEIVNNTTIELGDNTTITSNTINF